MPAPSPTRARRSSWPSSWDTSPTPHPRASCSPGSTRPAVCTPRLADSWIETRTLVGRSGTADVAAHLALTAAFCALCRGDLDETVQLLEARIAADGGVGAVGEPLGVAPLLVEAYAGLGRAADAAALAERYAEASRFPLPPTAALVSRCRALGCADDAAAAAAFEESLAHHGLAPDPFETAHTRLLYGARLRRSGRRTQAREQLAAAAGQFAGMDLVHWVQQAETELRATGQTARPRHPLPEEPLTAQETRVAVTAARGLSNREIAAALFLSPKTVEHHLSSVYRKRGLRSRVQLANAFRVGSVRHLVLDVATLPHIGSRGGPDRSERGRESGRLRPVRVTGRAADRRRPRAVARRRTGARQGRRDLGQPERLGVPARLARVRTHRRAAFPGQDGRSARTSRAGSTPSARASRASAPATRCTATTWR